MASVALAGGILTACSASTPAPFRSQPPLAGSVIAARVIAEDVAFDPAVAGRARFVPCQGLPACLRTTASTDFYPGALVPSDAEKDVRFTEEFVLYLVGATFDQATFDQTVVHVRVQPQAKGFQIVKLDGQDVLPVVDPTFSFEDESGRVLCTSSWEGCG